MCCGFLFDTLVVLFVLIDLLAVVICCLYFAGLVVLLLICVSLTVVGLGICERFLGV